MKKALFVLFAIAEILSVNAQKKSPKLVVGIVVDQMRYDYIPRFWNRYSDNGFKKLVSEGFSCTNHHFNYMPTYTGPGHASVYTGTTPKDHAIIANDWYDRSIQNYVYCTQEDSCKALGMDPEKASGKMAPNRLEASTITDELKLATNHRSKVIGISIKDRGAILPAGHMADAAYWFQGGDIGSWVSSSYYMSELPAWIKKYNKGKPAEKFLEKNWETLYPIETYTQSRQDNNHYEDLFEGEETPVFPHLLPKLRASNSNYSLIKATPMGNTMLKDFAKSIVDNEEMGVDDITDFLAVSFSSTDYVGHQFGPKSVEIEDTYLRLDQDIADLLSFLEKKVGKENFLIFLTADHGAVHVPQYLMDNKQQGGHFDDEKLEQDLKSFVENQFGSRDLIANVSNYQVFFNKNKISELQINEAQFSKKVVEFIKTQNGVNRVMDAGKLMNTDFTDPIVDAMRNGCHQIRSGEVLFTLSPGWVARTNKKGTTHGSPYSYDTHVPFILYGNGIPRGQITRKSVIPDIASTIARWLDIQEPNSCTGNPINEIFEK